MTTDPTPAAGYSPDQAEPLGLALAFIRATAADDLVAQGYLWDRIDELRANDPDDTFTVALAHIALQLGTAAYGNNLDSHLADTQRAVLAAEARHEH